MSRLRSYGDGAFSVSAPTLWNRLPADIRNASSLEHLKSVLKTHLLKLLSQINNCYLLNLLLNLFRHIIWGIIILHII